MGAPLQGWWWVGVSGTRQSPDVSRREWHKDKPLCRQSIAQIELINTQRRKSFDNEAGGQYKYTLIDNKPTKADITIISLMTPVMDLLSPSSVN